MAVGRPKVNLAAVRAQAVARLEDSQPARDRRRRLARLGVVAANALTIVLLSLSFQPWNQWYLGYVALVSWTLALVRNPHPRRAVLWAVLTGLVFWAANLYWLTWPTLAGYASSVLYLSVYFLAAGIILRAALRRNWPATLVLPIIWVALEYARNFVISGFPWFFLGHSQVPVPAMIQIADTTGQYGVSFFVAMVNGLVIDIAGLWAFKAILPAPRRPRRTLISAAVTVLVAAGIIAYGMWRMGEVVTRPGPAMGVVQQAYPIHLGEKGESSERIQARHIESSKAFVGTGIDLLVWPESMAVRWINVEAQELKLDTLKDEPLRCLAAKFYANAWNPGLTKADVLAGLEDRWQARDSQKAAEDIAALSRELKCAIIVGSGALHRNPNPIDRTDHWVVGNAALLFDRSWKNVGEYDKIHLVPMSEYVPFKHEWPWMYQTLRELVPPVMEQLEPGDKYTAFEIKPDKSDSRTWRVVTPICYEGTFDRVCRNLVYRDGYKVADVMVNMSNDGWFIWPKDGLGWGWPSGGSTELPQHMAQYCFRAVENRVPVVRAVNTGISASIDSCGRIVAVVNQYGKTDMVTGCLLLKDGATSTAKLQAAPSVGVDDRVTIYGRVGDVFAMAVSALAVIMCVMLAIARFRRPKTVPPENNTK